MKLGIYIRLYGRPDGSRPPPGWASILDQAVAAEAAGLDLIVLEDGAMYPAGDSWLGVWEAVSMAAAVAASTTRIGIGHAVINSPYRNPTLVARTAETLDEISGGRYTLGIGLGNTADDYGPLGVAADHRYGRFEEAIQIIRELLKTGRATFDGEYYRADGAKLVLRGPRPGGPPIVVAGQGPKMLRLAARFGDGWNWWIGGAGDRAKLANLTSEVDRACEEVGRDPATLPRSLDVFDVATGGVPAFSGSDGSLRIGGSVEEVAEALLGYRELGFDEIRCNLAPPEGGSLSDAIAWLGDVLPLVHAG